MNLVINLLFQSQIIIMTTKLEKLQRVRLPGGVANVTTTKMPAYNQTIIINNPNININYMNDSSKANANGPLSSRGLDNWHLNNNLKQFSETRQLGFFKGKRNDDSSIRNKSNSPYIIHKVRTQDIKSINKIYGGKTARDPLKDTLTSLRKHETLDHLPVTNDLKEDNNTASVLEKIITRHDKTLTNKFYQGQIKRNPRVDIKSNFDTLPTAFLNNHITNPQSTHPKSFRRNRFELPDDHKIILSERKLWSQEQIQENGKIEDDKIEDGDSSDEPKQQSKVAPRVMSFQLRKRAFTKTIQNINKALLSQTEDYLDRNYGQRVQQSEIELFVNSLNQPEHLNDKKDRSFQQSFNEWGQYDFHFEQERKKRPRTPRRKKPYELNQ